MSRKKIFITGGAGFIGSHIADMFYRKKWKVMIGDNFSTGSMDNIRHLKCEIRELDITELPMMDNSGGMWQQMLEFKPDVVCHLAAQPSLLVSWDKPMFDASQNIYGTLNVLRSAANAGVRHFIYASSSAVYNNDLDVMSELDITQGDPSSPYGISKRAAEMYVRMLYPNHTIFRFANIYGPRQQPLGQNQLIPRAIRHLLYEEPFQIFGDGEQTRDYTFVGDVAQAHYKAVRKEIYGTFNLASGVSTSVNQVLAYLDRLLGRKTEYGHVKAVENRPKIAMDNSKLMIYFGQPTFTPLNAGLKETLDWWSTQNA